MRGFKTIISAGFLASALVLAGCGGGSDDNGMGEMPMEMTPEEKAKAEAEAAKAEAAEAKRKQEEAEKALAEEKKRQEEKAAADARKALASAAKKLFGVLNEEAATTYDERHQQTYDLATLGSNAANVDAYDPRKNKQGSDSGFSYTDFMETKGGKTSHVRIYSTAKSRQVLFEKQYGAGALTITAAHAPRIKGDGFADAGTPKTHVAVNNAVKVNGSFQGASGTYSCDASSNTCLSQKTDTGIILSGAWTFSPNAGQMVTMPDNDFVQFGWWLNEDAAAGTAAANAKIRTFVDPTSARATSGVDTLTTSATYRGIAVGKAVVHEPVEGRNVSGAFTATAVLNADFDRNAAGAAGQSISGTINGFTVGDVSPDWSVELHSMDLDESGVWGATRVAETTTWSIDGEKAADSGSWQGALLGQSAPSSGGAALLPTEAAGGFDSSYGDVGHMIGAFGAGLDN